MVIQWLALKPQIVLGEPWSYDDYNLNHKQFVGNHGHTMAG